VRAIEQAMEYGVRQMGVTVHFVDEGVDTGPILLQEAFKVDPYALGVEEIESKVHAIEHELLPRAIRLIAAGAVRPDPEAPGRRVIVEQTDLAPADGGGSSGDE
jgi:phosphoribosylglycinamide formyltransferase-1